jgi:signal transduction histidine kinase
MRLGLHSRITLAILGLICLLVPILAGILYSQFSKSMEATRQSNKAAMTDALLTQATKRGLDVAGLLGESLANHFYYYHIGEMRDLVDATVHQHGVLSVFVFDKNARIVIDGTETLETFGQVLKNRQTTEVLATGEPLTRIDDDILLAYMPVMVGSEILGGIELSISLSDIRTDIEMAGGALDAIDALGRDNMFMASGLVTLVFVLVGFVFSAMVARGISGPIEQLAGLTRKIGRGELDVDPPILRKDEIGELASSLCQMARARKETEAEALRLQSEIAHFSRVSAAGEMATSLAHELNQPLAAVSSFVSGCVIRLKKTGNADPELLEAMNRATEEALRAGEIIRRVREFVQKHALEHQIVDLNETIRETVELVRLDAKWHDVRVGLDLFSELPQIRGDWIQMQQVIFNILRNAMDALGDMPSERKEISIASRTTNAGDVQVSIVDRGPGIEPEMQDGMFDPFVTSKRDGLGMGLPICRSIIESHGGSLRMEQTGSAGTTFSFSLKKADGSPAPAENTSVT